MKTFRLFPSGKKEKKVLKKKIQKKISNLAGADCWFEKQEIHFQHHLNKSLKFFKALKGTQTLWNFETDSGFKGMPKIIVSFE